MEKILNLMQKMFIFEKEPQRIGLSQFKEAPELPKKEQPTKSKDIKLSDLMRRAS